MLFGGSDSVLPGLSVSAECAGPDTIMKKVTILITIVMSFAYGQSWRDTLWYDMQGGNYIVQYVGEGDTLVSVVFEPATKINPIISANVDFNASQEKMVYHYLIENGGDSKQNLFSFQVEYKAPVTDVTANRWQSRKVQEGTVETLEDGGRRWVTSDAGRWAWSGFQGLQPTWRKNGFGLESSGIPGRRVFPG